MQASQVLPQYLFILTELTGIAKPVILKKVSTYFWPFSASQRTELNDCFGSFGCKALTTVEGFCHSTLHLVSLLLDKLNYCHKCI